MNTTTELLTLDTCVAASPDVIYAELSGEVSLLNTRTGVYHTMNAVGSTVWQHIQQATPLREVAKRLIEEYDVEPARCFSDLLRLVDNLRAHELIVITPA